MNNPLLLLICLVIPLIIWDGVWKLIALWKSARNDQLPRFICLAIFNPAGVLPILYIRCFQKNGSQPPVAIKGVEKGSVLYFVPLSSG